MKTLITLSVAVFFLFSAFAKAQSTQTCNCVEELSFINEQIKGMTSFKKQMKGNKLSEYTTTLNQLEREVTTQMSVTDCFSKLNALLSVVKDKHAHIRHMKPVITSEIVDQDVELELFRESELFKNHPKSNMSVEELIAELSEKSFESLEGIYEKKESMTVGIIKKGDAYEGVVLTSNNKGWIPGQIAYRITPNGENMYDVLTSDIPGGKLRYVRGLLYSNGRLWHLKKEATNVISEVKEDQIDWEFKQLTPDTQYVYMGTFSNNSKNVAAFKKFYEKTKDKFTAKNIIVDLRDNSGGNSKYSDPFYKIFKKNKMNVYVVTNFWCGSNGEQFTLKLKGLKNAKHLGQRTYGALAYGSNYGNLINSPSGQFAIYPTDMNFHKFINYEYVGVQPEIKLSFDKDWIIQTLDIIENNN
ncbi:S41 family peptidase [Dokdonia sp. Asnod1-B02]|uniref:S41 family peptidase n=1 Tax=Dokdonia sp. Asnod1-B02 TaxID=3160573 RepID=UPI003865D00F